MDPFAATPPPSLERASGLRRTVATAALALGLLVVGGTAVVMAASPDPGASASPTVTDPSTDGVTDTDLTTDGMTAPATERGSRGRAPDGSKPDCPEGAGPADDGGTSGDDGTTATDDSDDSTVDTTPSTEPTTEPTPDPTPDPTETPTQDPSPTATPAV